MSVLLQLGWHGQMYSFARAATRDTGKRVRLPMPPHHTYWTQLVEFQRVHSHFLLTDSIRRNGIAEGRDAGCEAGCICAADRLCTFSYHGVRERRFGATDDSGISAGDGIFDAH